MLLNPFFPDSGLDLTSSLRLQGLGLVFVAVYQRALKLLYVDELLERVKREFATEYKPDQVKVKYTVCDSQRLVCSLSAACSSNTRVLKTLSGRC